MSEAEAIKMSKRSKKVPVLDQLKYRVDKEIEKESKMNPLLVKQKPLELPLTVVSHLRALKDEIQAKKKRDRLPAMTRVQSQKEMLNNNSLSSGLSLFKPNNDDLNGSQVQSSRFQHNRSSSFGKEPVLPPMLQSSVKNPNQATPIYIG